MSVNSRPSSRGRGRLVRRAAAAEELAPSRARGGRGGAFSVHRAQRPFGISGGPGAAGHGRRRRAGRVVYRRERRWLFACARGAPRALANVGCTTGMLLEEPLSNDRPAKASSMLAVPLSLPSSTSSKDALELRASDADRADAPRERAPRLEHEAISHEAELINVLIRVWTFLLSQHHVFTHSDANFHSNMIIHQQ